jgi:hypothetical protein
MAISDIGERVAFLHRVLTNGEARTDQVADLVWFNQRAGIGETELASAITELESAGMPKQNRSRLAVQLSRCAKLVRGTRRGFVRLSPMVLEELDRKNNPLAYRPTGSDYLPTDILPPRKPYNKIVEQLNASFALGLYDCAAVMARRLVEVLLIEVFVAHKRVEEIRPNGTFMMLDAILRAFAADASIHRNRHVVRDLGDIKMVGDTAAHSRTHITSKPDLDDIAFRYRRSISELAALAKL